GMRRALAATVLVTLLAPQAFAQTAAGQAVRTVPTQPEIAAQATFDTSYLLALYMVQLAAAGAAPPQLATACPPTDASTLVPQRAEQAPPAVREPAIQCQAGPSAPSRIPPALGGALLGALAVALWSRSRPVRAARTRDDRAHSPLRRGRGRRRSRPQRCARSGLGLLGSK